MRATHTRGNSQVHELGQGHRVRFWPSLQHVRPDQLGELSGVQLQPDKNQDGTKRRETKRRKGGRGKKRAAAGQK